MAAAVLYWSWFRWFTGICLEDALITYRYAQNLAAGHGFVYNPGERVLGTTSPLLTLVLAASGYALGPARIPLACNVWMLVAALAVGPLAHATLRTLGWSNRVSTAVILPLYFHPSMVWVATGGMETPLVVCLMFLSLYALVSNRHTLAVFAASLLVLTRLDGAIWASLICGAVLWRARQRALLPFLAGAAVLLPWFSFSLGYFHSPLPHSIAAKRAIHPEQFGSSLADFAAYGRWLLQSIGMTEEVELQHIGAYIWAGLACFGVVAIARAGRRRPLWVLPAFVLLYWLSFFLGRAPMAFPWYQIPLTVCSLTLGTVGAAEFAAAMGAYQEKYNLPQRTPTWLMTAVLAACSATFVYQNYASAIHHQMYQTNEDGLRREVGEWLRDQTPREAVIAMEAIGYQGYYAGRRVIDLAGLVSPDVVRIRASSRTNGESFLRILRELRPHCLVLRSFEVDTNRHYDGGPLFSSQSDRDYFDTHYEEWRRFAAPLPALWSDRAFLTVYRRVQ